MRTADRTLLNTTDVEAWPACLLRARSNQDARLLANAAHVLRAKRGGGYVAVVSPDGLVAPLAGAREPAAGLQAIRHALALHVAQAARRYRGPFDTHDLPLDRLQSRLCALGIDAQAYVARTGLQAVAEPSLLHLAGHDRYRRALWLRADAARAWQSLRAAALRDEVLLEAISGYRSHDYQLAIFDRKLARGQALEEILRVNAAPGFSEHHAGRALDIGTPGEPAAEESFETTPAFAWLQRNAGVHGFGMSYPRDNPHGIVYEPWHWRFDPLASTG